MTTKFYKNKIYNILTQDGFKHFDGLQVTKKTDILLVKTNVGHFYVTKNHEFFYTKKSYKPISEFKVGDSLYSLFDNVTIENIVELDCEMNVYDIIEVEDVNSFSVTNSGIIVKNCCYIDEMAFIDNDVEFYTSTYPVLTSGKRTKLIITSTPNGMNLFFKIYNDSVNGNNNFKNYKVSWREHPDRDDKWAEEQLRNMSEQQFAVEFESVSSITLLNIREKTDCKEITIGELYDYL